MDWTEKQINYIIQDMTDENPLACRALLSISKVEFTEKVPTMAVSLSKNPVLKINLSFCRKHLTSENDVKTVLLHEFLHVLLLHTEKYEVNNPLLNIALDAIINSIIFRYKGMEYADFFTRFYRWEKITFLLRPRNDEKQLDSEWRQIHEKIYSGKYCADDLYELLEYLKNKIHPKYVEHITLLGDHQTERIPDEIKNILDGILEKMDGALIWSKPGLRGIGEKLYDEKKEIEKYKRNKWEHSTRTLLKKCLLPDEKIKKEEEVHEAVLPVLSGSDRRAMARFKYNRMIPFSKNESRKPSATPLATIYLDVSGSMDAEICALISLLDHFKQYIKTPLWVFSGEVVPARFKDGKLEYESSGGTVIEPVFDHIRKNKIGKSLIVSDGYVETITEAKMKGLKKENIHVLVSADGNPQKFMETGFPYRQLEKL